LQKLVKKGRIIEARKKYISIKAAVDKADAADCDFFRKP
jgi:hypothetical protein